MRQDKDGKFSKIIKDIVIGLLMIILMINIYIIIQAKLKPNSVPSIFGYKPFIVLSGSMETEIYVGDLVFVKEVDSSTLQVNDIIAFRDSENLVTTHRIINIVNSDNGRCFETKGDNNNTKDDGMVCSDKIEGKYHSKISKLGHVILFVQQPLGFAVMMMTIFIVCMFIYIFTNRKNNNHQMDLEEMKEFEEYKKAKREQQERNKK